MKIAVYCGSSESRLEIYNEAAAELGKWIGSSGRELVYGGGTAGLMGVVSKAAFESGAKVTGVVPGNIGFIKDRPQPYVNELITTQDMSSRKKVMMDISDAFIALPGGIGTLDEISEAITMVRIGTYRKPCIFFNKAGYYDSVKVLFEKMAEAGYVESSGIKDVLFSEDLSEIASFIGKYYN